MYEVSVYTNINFKLLYLFYIQKLQDTAASVTDWVKLSDAVAETRQA
jgi:hypothetical protein